MAGSCAGVGIPQKPLHLNGETELSSLLFDAQPATSEDMVPESALQEQDPRAGWEVNFTKIFIQCTYPVINHQVGLSEQLLLAVNLLRNHAISALGSNIPAI